MSTLRSFIVGTVFLLGIWVGHSLHKKDLSATSIPPYAVSAPAFSLGADLTSITLSSGTRCDWHFDNNHEKTGVTCFMKTPQSIHDDNAMLLNAPYSKP